MLRKLEDINWLMVFMHLLSFTTVTFVVLKIAAVFTFSWWLVLIPTFILLGIHLYIFMIVPAVMRHIYVNVGYEHTSYEE